MVNGAIIGPDRRLCAGFVAELSRRHDAEGYEQLDTDPNYRRDHWLAMTSLLAFEQALLTRDDALITRTTNALDQTSARILAEIWEEAEAKDALR